MYALEIRDIFTSQFGCESYSDLGFVTNYSDLFVIRVDNLNAIFRATIQSYYYEPVLSAGAVCLLLNSCTENC